MKRRRFVRHIDLETGRIIHEAHYLGRVEHRDPNEGPSSISRDVEYGVVRRELYRVNGKVHRDNGPAFIVRDEWPLDHVTYEKYCRHGRPHRDPKEGPAEIRYTRSLKVASEEKYWWKGDFHRDPNDGPAVLVRHYRTGAILREEYWVNGEKISDPSHRLPGPRMHPDDPEANWARFSHEPRDEFPEPSRRWIVEEFDLEASRLTRVAYYITEEGKPLQLHGEANEGPALLERDPETGRVTRAEYRVHNRLHREGGPARIERANPQRDWMTLEEFRQNGLLRRDPANGPAVIERDPKTGAVVREEFWLKGKRVPGPQHPAPRGRQARDQKPRPR
jgi:hypothetical protein